MKLTSDKPHIAVISSPVPGHLNPLQVLGKELVARGCRVTLVHVRDAERFVTGDAISFAPLPDRSTGHELFEHFLAKLARPTGPVGVGRMIRATAALSGALLDGAPAVLERIGADAVIADAVEPAGRLIAQRMNLPCIVSVTGLPLLHEENVPPPFLGWHYRPDALGRFRNRGGYAVSDWLMRPVARVLDAYSDEAGRAYRSEAGRRSNVKRATCTDPKRATLGVPVWVVRDNLSNGVQGQASSAEARRLRRLSPVRSMR